MQDLDPVDDAFIRTAIRGLRPPDHHPAFWGELTSELDAAEEILVAQGVLVAAPAEPLVVPLPEPVVAPKRQVHVAAPVAAAPAVAAPVHPPRREPLRAGGPAHAAPAGSERIRAFGPDAPGGPARAKVKVRHDPTLVPHSLRRSSNAVLLAVAAVAATVALVAGLTLVRQRSDDGGSPPSEQPTEPGSAAPDDPATGLG